MEIKTIPPDTGGSSAGAILADGTVPLTSEWDTGNFQIKGPSAVYVSSTEPTSPYTGMLWSDTSIASRHAIKKWDGSAWVQIGGVEASARTISLTHDHGALLTGADITSALESIAYFGSSSVTIEIDNKTVKNLTQGAVVNAGSGKVKIPVPSGHGFVAGEVVCIDGTTNYSWIFAVDSVEETYVIVNATYVAETVQSTAVIRTVIQGGINFSGTIPALYLSAVGYTSGANQKQPVVIYNTDSSANAIRLMSLPKLFMISGIKFISFVSDGMVFRNCGYVLLESCSTLGATSKVGVTATENCFLWARRHSFRNINYALYANVNASLVSQDCSTFSTVLYGLVADFGGTVKKASATQPTGSTANEYAITSRGGQII